MQGVSINIFVKTARKKKNELDEIFHFDLFGKRAAKYDFLNKNSLKLVNWKQLESRDKNLFFARKDFALQNQYDTRFELDELFPTNTSGIKTHDDENLVSSSRLDNFNQTYYFRPFDTRNICYDLKRVQRHRFSVMKNMLKENISLLIPRQAITGLFGFFVSKGLNDINYTGTAGQFGAGLTFPLYLYPEANEQSEMFASTARTPNLKAEIVNQIASRLDLQFTTEKEGSQSFITSIS